MKPIINHLRENPLAYLLIAIPLALVSQLVGFGSSWVFVLSAVAVIPLAGYIGSATESLAAFTGPKVGGLLNATLGNAAELIITIVAISAGQIELVKASITGSILGNLLLVLGMAMILGGAKHGTQKFDRQQTSNQATLLTLSILAMVIPSFFSHFIGGDNDPKVEGLSLGVAIVMIALYILGLIFSLKTTKSPITYEPTIEDDHHAQMSIKQAVILLAVATIGVVGMSELLVGAVESVVNSWGLSEFFLGIILIPIVGNVAEHLVAVQVALKNHMNLSVEIASSSSVQVALFVAPLLVFLSLAIGHPLTLIFNTFELMALGAGVLIMILVSADGESNWLEGSALVGVYIILGLAFFLLPIGV